MGFNHHRSPRKETRFNLRFAYEQLEYRKVLAPLFPVYVGSTLTLGNPDSAAEAPYPLSQTFNLSTNPGASKTLYLDFNGHRSFNNDWGHDIQFPAERHDQRTIARRAHSRGLQRHCLRNASRPHSSDWRLWQRHRWRRLPQQFWAQ